MKRRNLEHIIRASGSIADCRELIIVGSQAILGSFPNAPAEPTFSEEAVTFPLKTPEKADLIDGSIGEKSPFHETFGYYAHGVAPDTAVLPGGWKERLVPVQNENTNGITGFCLSPVDLVVSKLACRSREGFRVRKSDAEAPSYRSTPDSRGAAGIAGACEV